MKTHSELDTFTDESSVHPWPVLGTNAVQPRRGMIKLLVFFTFLSQQLDRVQYDGIVQFR